MSWAEMEVKGLDRQVTGRVAGEGRSQKTALLSLLQAYGSGDRLRVYVLIDHSYAFQSRAKIERWDGARWNEVARILAEEIGPVKDHGELNAVENRLLDLANRVMNG